MKSLLAFMMFITLANLIACGGGGGGGSSTPLQNPDGFYTGTFTDSGITYNLLGMVYDNKITAISTDAGAMYSGNIGMSGNKMTGTVDVLEIGGSYSHTSKINATVNEGVSISGTATDQYGTSSFTMDYDSLYERTPDLNVVAGTYSLTSGLYTMTMTISTDGSYSASDTDGCDYSGMVTPVDNVHNLYNFTSTVTNCGTDNGTYAGKSFMDDFNTTNDTFVIVIDNSAFVLVATLLRQ